MPRRKESRAQVGRGAVCCGREERHVQMCGGVLQTFTELTWLEHGRGRGRGSGRESHQADSPMSVEPDVGLDPRTLRS